MEGDRGSPEAQRLGSSGSSHTAEEKKLEEKKQKMYGRDGMKIVIYRRLSGGDLAFMLHCQGGASRLTVPVVFEVKDVR